MKKFKEKLEKLLKKEKTFLDENNEIDYIKVKDSADKIDSKLIEILILNKEIKNKFFTKIKNVFVFNTNAFKFFLEENKINNSYTQYKIRIGLTDGKKFLKNTPIARIVTYIWSLSVKIRLNNTVIQKIKKKAGKIS